MVESLQPQIRGNAATGSKSDARRTTDGSADAKISGAEKADHARAVAASVEAGAEDAQHKLQRATKQTGLTAGRAIGSGGGGSSSGGRSVKAEEAGGCRASTSEGKEDPQEQLQHETKQTGLKPGAGSGSAGASTRGSDKSKRPTRSGTQQEPNSETAPTGSGGDDEGQLEAGKVDPVMRESTGAEKAGGAERSRSLEERQLQLDKSEHKVAPKRDGRRNSEVCRINHILPFVSLLVMPWFTAEVLLAGNQASPLYFPMPISESVK